MKESLRLVIEMVTIQPQDLLILIKTLFLEELNVQLQGILVVPENWLQ